MYAQCQSIYIYFRQLSQLGSKYSDSGKANKNGLTLNHNKTKSICICYTRLKIDLSSTNFFLNGNELFYYEEVKNFR